MDKCYFKAKPYNIGEEITMNPEDPIHRCRCTNYSGFADFDCVEECCSEGFEDNSTCIEQYENLTSPKCSSTIICSNII